MNLIDGSYTLNEVQAPAGYVILNNAIHFAIKDGVFQIVDMNADSFATMETTDAGTALRVKNLRKKKIRHRICSRRHLFLRNGLFQEPGLRAVIRSNR